MKSAQRAEIQKVQSILVAYKAQIGYFQKRPMDTRYVRTVTGLMRKINRGFSMDCSESVVLICHIAGIHDPTGNNYSGYGNSDSMLNHLPHYYDPKQALAGAIIIFNSNYPLQYQHVAQVHAKDPIHGDPIVFTHGTAADPSFMRLSWLQAGFSGHTTLLSVARL